MAAWLGVLVTADRAPYYSRQLISPTPTATATATPTPTPDQENIYRHPEGGGAGNNWAMGYDMAQSVQDGLTLTP